MTLKNGSLREGECHAYHLMSTIVELNKLHVLMSIKYKEKLFSPYNVINFIFNKNLDCDWFSARLFGTTSRYRVGVQLQVSNFL